MKPFSSLPARLDIFGFCLIAALAAACSFDTSQLRALHDGAVEHSAGTDAAASGDGGDTPILPDAPTTTDGGGGAGGRDGAAGMDASGGAGAIGDVGGTTSSGGGGDAAGSGGGRDAGVPDVPSSQRDVPIGGAGGSAGGIAGVGGTTSGSIGGTGGVFGTGGSGDAGVPDVRGAQPDVPIGGTDGGFGTGGSTGVGAGGSSGTGGGPGSGGTTNVGGTISGGSVTGGTSTGGTSTGGTGEATGGTGTGGTGGAGGTGGTVPDAAVAPTILSIDFVGGGSAVDSGATGTAVMGASESAGVKPATHWNSAASNAGTLASLVLADGTTSSASATWYSPVATGETSATWSLHFTDTPGDVRMMNGYLDPRTTGSPATVSVTGLSSPMNSGYDVYVYCFVEMTWADTRTFKYTIGSTTHTVTQTEPPLVTAFSGYTLAPEAGAGNYVVFRNVTGTSFTLTATPGTSLHSTVRAPVNGIQIVYPSGS